MKKMLTIATFALLIASSATAAGNNKVRTNNTPTPRIGIRIDGGGVLYDGNCGNAAPGVTCDVPRPTPQTPQPTPQIQRPRKERNLNAVKYLYFTRPVVLWVR